MAAADAVDTAPAPTEAAPSAARPHRRRPRARPDWRAGLPPELLSRSPSSVQGPAEPRASAYVETKRKPGGPLEPPPADAKPEVVAAHRKRLGVPESPDKYDVTLPPPAEGTQLPVGSNAGWQA